MRTGSRYAAQMPLTLSVGIAGARSPSVLVLSSAKANHVLLGMLPESHPVQSNLCSCLQQLGLRLQPAWRHLARYSQLRKGRQARCHLSRRVYQPRQHVQRSTNL